MRSASGAAPQSVKANLQASQDDQGFPACLEALKAGVISLLKGNANRTRLVLRTDSAQSQR